MNPNLTGPKNPPKKPKKRKKIQKHPHILELPRCMGSGMVAWAHTRCPPVLEHGTRAHHLSALPTTCGVEGDTSSFAMYTSQHP
jgi:hypothetical protein